MIPCVLRSQISPQLIPAGIDQMMDNEFREVNLVTLNMWIYISIKVATSYLDIWVLSVALRYFIHKLLIDINHQLQKIGPSCGWNVTRCGIWWAEMLKARDQFKDAAGVYFRISGEVMPIIMNIKLMRYCSVIIWNPLIVRNLCILLWCLSKQRTASYCPHQLC